MVLATAVPAMPPTKLSTPAITTANRIGNTPVDTTVAIALAASWNPLMKSKTSAATMTRISSSTMLDRQVRESVGDALAVVDRGFERLEHLALAQQHAHVDLGGV